MNKVAVGIGALVIIILAGFAFYSSNDTSQGDAPGVSEREKQQLIEGINDPFVRHIRTAIDNFKAGKNEGYSEVNFDEYRSYLDSKFVLMAVNNNALGGGKDMLIVFEQKPDAIFYAWVYDHGDGSLDLRSFKIDDQFSPQQARENFEGSRALIEELSLAI